ncbi:hypothetical protein D3C71_1326470 [compost metagenome]
MMIAQLAFQQFTLIKYDTVADGMICRRQADDAISRRSKILDVQRYGLYDSRAKDHVLSIDMPVAMTLHPLRDGFSPIFAQ